nr:putative Ig domain-containing protein [Streptomyces sp. CB03238]
MTDPGARTCAFNQSCTVQITATGGKAPLKYAATGLPFGLSIDAATGRITGKPWQVGTLRVTATVTDSTGASAAAAFPLTVNWF